MRILPTSLFIAPALLGSACSGALYDEYILAPSSRDLVPASVYQVNGSVTGAASLSQASRGNATFRGPSAVTYDFGRNIGGVVSLDVLSASSPDAFLGVTFTESSMWISSEACDATADSGRDSPLWFHAGQGPGRYIAERKHVRGAFRYLTVSSNTTATISVRGVHIKYTAAPFKDLRAYTGYFHCNEDLINRIWYAGAYTNQLGTIDPDYGNSLVSEAVNVTLPETVPWWSNTTISNGSSVITDGAKRDRLVWPGDMSIALESIAVSTADLYSVRTGLESLFVLQRDDGQLPYVGTPLGVAVSFTYHLHSLIGAFYYHRYSGDHHWIAGHWDQYKRAIRWAVSSVDETGLANVTLSADWLRFGMGGHVSLIPTKPGAGFSRLTVCRTSKRTPFCITCSARRWNSDKLSTTRRTLRDGQALPMASSQRRTSGCGMMVPGCIMIMRRQHFIPRMAIHGQSRPT